MSVIAGCPQGESSLQFASAFKGCELKINFKVLNLELEKDHALFPFSVSCTRARDLIKLGSILLTRDILQTHERKSKSPFELSRTYVCDVISIFYSTLYEAYRI